MPFQNHLFVRFLNNSRHCESLAVISFSNAKNLKAAKVSLQVSEVNGGSTILANVSEHFKMTIQ